ncbi:HpcH/HpaI aldolase/citrate lyase family protein [Nocardia farcinica]|uniref:HpcH/HpaI aldolase/citrate lyase family protein n=1 Tax=Nocardia farcinica TaxID=37329 RepID=UPI002454455C|nr:aldolase/citrate lyase family protein [Nocardia farcinica]
MTAAGPAAPARRVPATHARSWLLVPADDADRYATAAASAADAVVLDLEDGVAADRKADARAEVARLLRSGHRAWVRINDADSVHWSDDLAALAELPGLAGVVLAKTEHGEQVDATAARLPGGLPIVALVESAAGLEASGEIAGRPATTRLAFGSGDFRRDTGIARDPAVLAYPRCRLTVASRAAGLPGPVDGPTVGADPALLRSETADAAAAGMTGRLCLRAEHTAVVNDLLSPSPDDIASATALLRRYRAGGPRDGSDAPRLARAEQVVALARVFDRDAVTARR